MSSAKAETAITSMKLRILTPRRIVFEGEVDSLQAEGAGGTLEILPRHEAVMTPLAIGVLDVASGETRARYAVHGGFLDMDGQNVTVLADAAENAEEIDFDRAQAALARAKERLAKVSGPAADVKVDIDRAKLALLRALQRIRIKEEERPRIGE